MAASSTSGQGRPKGVPNKATADLKALAQVHGPAVIAKLAVMAGLTTEAPAENEGTRVAAMKELLDRGYGKSVQPQSGPDGESDPVVRVIYHWGDPPK